MAERQSSGRRWGGSMRFIELCAGGVAGISRGLEATGMECVGHAEIDPARRWLLYRAWPNVPQWGDIARIRGADLPEHDLLAAGFPCQPASLAGARKGQDDERWLWPEVARLVREARPRWVFLENVPGLLSVNSGAGFGEILRDLAGCGYDAEWTSFGAAHVGAPHLRVRVWIVAYPAGEGSQRCGLQGQSGSAGEGMPLADASGIEGGERRDLAGERGRQNQAEQTGLGGSTLADAEQRRHACGVAAPVIFGPEAAGALERFRETVGRAQWEVESAVCRLAYGPASRLAGVSGADLLSALGDAVVMQCAQFVGERIMAADRALGAPQRGA